MNADTVVGRLLIGGEWSEARADFSSMSPLSPGQTIGQFPAASIEETHQAVAAASVAFPGWRRTSRIARAECFDRLGVLLARDLEPLATLMARECGKTISECRAEVLEGLHMVQYVFGSGRHPIGEILGSEIADKDAFVQRKPWGVVAVISPWNFPFAVPLWMLGPSLMEGNTAVFKPSEDSPAVGQRLVELFVEAGFPKGVINLVHGDGMVGETLVRHPRVNVILFTGSYDVGRRILSLSAGIVNRSVAAEMGSKSALIVCEDAQFDIAVNAGVISAFKSTGQRCVSAGRILVHESLFTSYARALVGVAKRLKFADPFDPQTFAGPLIHEQAVKKVLDYNALAVREGGQVLLDVNPTNLRGPCYLTPFIYQANPKPGHRAIREEVFGPHLALIPFRTDEEAIAIYNDTDFGLSMGLVTENYRRMRLYREECDYGIGYVNLPCIGAEVHLPFGGVKKSGNGRPSAAGLVQTVTYPTAWTVNYGTDIRMAQGLPTDFGEDTQDGTTGPNRV